jgi:glycosyltransferase involved in cell wall biosynthesis
MTKGQRPEITMTYHTTLPKVAHFIDSHDPGGAETLVVEMCRKIEAYGYIPEVYHFGNPWLEEKCREFDIPSFFAPGHKWYKSAVTLPLFIPVFARFLKQRHVDILHSHLFGPVTGACFSANLAGIPHIGTLHDIYTVEEKKKRIRYIQLSSLLGTRLVTVSRQMKTYLAGLGRFSDAALQTIVNGMDLDKFNISSSREQYPELELGPDDIVLICVGRLETIKGHDILLKAFGKIQTGKHIKLLIVGDGPCRQEIKQQIGEMGLQQNVKMLGQRNDIPGLLNLSDCFVLSSRSEGLSCSIIEAMAAGLPVIATDVGGNSELVVQGENGYLIPPDNAGILSLRLKFVIDDAALRRRLGEMSQQLAKEHYSLDAMMQKYADNYDAMLEKNGAYSGGGRKQQFEKACSSKIK